MDKTDLKLILKKIIYYASIRGVKHMNIKDYRNKPFIYDFYHQLTILDCEKLYLAFLRLRVLAQQLSDFK